MAKTIRVDLPEEGPDKYVDVRNPMFMRVKEQRLMTQRENESADAYNDRMIPFIILGGNIVAEDGRLLQYPLNEADIEELTIYTISQVMNAFKDAMKDLQPEKN